MKILIVQSNTLKELETWNSQFYTTFNNSIEKVKTSKKEDLINELKEYFEKIKPFIDYKTIEKLIKNTIDTNDNKTIEEIFKNNELEKILKLTGSKYMRIAVVFTYILTSNEIKDSISNSIEHIELELIKKLDEIKKFKSFIEKL